MSRRHLLTVVIALGVAGCVSGETRVSDPADIDQRIQFYSKKIARNDRLYPVYVQLASAYFDKARVSFNPRWLDEARRALLRSISIVETHEAFVVMARLSNYSHRFEETLLWGARAMEPLSEPADPGVVAILVEAHSALGQHAQARALLPPVPLDFYSAVAWAGWWSSQRRFQEAADAYGVAARLASAEDAVAAAAWAHVMAGGMALDAGRPDSARSHLDAAARINPRDALLRVHEAEYLAAAGQPVRALAIYEERLGGGGGDPDLHAAAFTTAIAAQQPRRARHHFEAAERGYRDALGAGEAHTLGALAALYLDAGTELETAAVLSAWNLWFRRDPAARQLAARARARY